MGIYASNYIIFGFHIDKKVIKKHEVNPYSEKTLPYVDGNPGFTQILIYDQVCGNYIVFGNEIYSKGQDNASGITPIDIKNYSMEEMDELTNKFIDAFGMDVYKTMEMPLPEILVFTHYS